MVAPAVVLEPVDVAASPLIDDRPAEVLEHPFQVPRGHVGDAVIPARQVAAPGDIVDWRAGAWDTGVETSPWLQRPLEALQGPHDVWNELKRHPGVDGVEALTTLDRLAEVSNPPGDVNAALG